MASDETTQSAAAPTVTQSAGDGRSASRGERREGSTTAGKNGEACGTSGGTATLVQSWLLIGAVALVVMTVNALSSIDDNPMNPAWQPWVWEVSSATVIVGLVWIPWLAYRRATPEGGLLTPRFWLIHGLALLAFSAVHVAGFVAVRKLVYGAVGEQYDFGPLERVFPYELRKDLLTYAIFISVFWGVDVLRRRRHVAPSEPATFDILDGQRVIRVPLDQIVAITSAGNYVEFLLEDGRKPLMRAPLTAVEGDLAERGFVRTHRSWLVNRTRVTGLRPEGSGDWSVELGAVEVPLSRRFKVALEQLKDG